MRYLKSKLIEISSILAILVGIFIFKNYNSEKIKDSSIFSWSSKVAQNNSFENIYEIVDKLNIKNIYQNLNGLSSQEIKEFVKAIKENTNSNIYYLAGDPNWYNEYEEVTKNLEFIIEYNNSVEDKFKIKGIVLDIEPWAIYEEWDRDSYKETLIKTYEYCNLNNLKLINVLPFWLEEEVLEEIVINSDEIAVMNYNINNPIRNIKEEVELSKKYNKKINIIAEIQQENEEYGVLKNTTYYYEGYDKLIEDWENIYNEYKYKNMKFSYNDYNNIFQFLRNE